MNTTFMSLVKNNLRPSAQSVAKTAVSAVKVGTSVPTSPRLLARSALSFIIYSLSFIIALSSASAATYYVKPTGNNSAAGTSWGNALASVGTAISKAASGDEIWIAAGTYKQGAALTMKNGVGIYGGFLGNETNKNQRALWKDGVIQNETIIDGNSTHRVFLNDFTSVSRINSTAKLDSVTVANGYVNRTAGGGMYNKYASPTITNCIFKKNVSVNTGGSGGGICNISESSPQISDCFFIQNSCTGYNGGAISNLQYSAPNIIRCYFDENTAGYGAGIYNSASSPTINNCTFVSNSAASDGSGMYNTSSSPIVTNCTFSQNKTSSSSAYTYGGGMYNASSSPTITNCTFSDNHTGSGSGMYNTNSNPTLTNCTFSNNFTNNYGGGMHNTSSSSPTLINCSFNNNTATISGGGIYNNASDPNLDKCTFNGNSATSPQSGNGGGIFNTNNSNPELSNCTFSGNFAGYGGGGLRNDASSPTITNCTFSGNSASYQGGGICNVSSSTRPEITNCIIWGNTASNGAQIYNYLSATPTVIYSIVQGTTVYAGAGNKNTDPLLRALANNGGFVQTMLVQAGSPAINSGATQSQANSIHGVGVVTIPTTDALGRTRNTSTQCTIGAVEYGVIYTLSYNGNGHTGGTAPETVSVFSGTPITLPPSGTLVKVGYAFAGWNTNSAGTGTTYTAGTSYLMPTSNTTLYAHWTASISNITFHANGGSGGTANTVAAYGSAMPSATAPIRTGYTFLGYFDAASGGTQYYSPTMASSRNWDKMTDATLFAQWNANQYTITFNANGGSGGTSSTTATYGSAMPSATAPTYEDQTFLGYFDAASGGTQYYSARMASTRNWDKASNATLYARWGYETHADAGVGRDYSIEIPQPSNISTPVYSAKGLATGLKINKTTGEITGIPTKLGTYTAVVTITDKYDKYQKETTTIVITVAPIAPNAIGTFTGCLIKDNAVVGTWKMTVNKAGKITAKVTTTEGTFAFKSNSWDALDTNDLATYSVSMRMLDKQKIYQTFSLDVDTANEWHSVAVVGTSSLAGSSTIAGIRNPFLDKKNYEAQHSLAPYIATRPQPNTYFITWTGSTVSQYLTRGKLNIKALDSQYGYLIFTVKKGGAISYKGRFASSQEKISGTSTLFTIGSGINNFDGLIPVFFWNKKTESYLRARFYLP